jgi:hypothetical protein
MLVSFCICLRNDNYGGDQQDRFRLFIDYYSKIQKRFPGCFEFVICDYNSPSERPVHAMPLPWGNLKPIRFVQVNEQQHHRASLGKGRPILDYLGRNVAVRHAQADFVGIFNQDIYISESILEYFAKGKGDKKYFYRADRWDVQLDKLQDHMSSFSGSGAQRFPKAINRRHSPEYEHITLDCLGLEPHAIASKPLRGEKYDLQNNIILEGKKSLFQATIQRLGKKVNFETLGLHTNASGDFIFCSKRAWHDIHGAIETTEFYLHLDSYLVAQLHGAGYRQAIFALPHQVLHAEHDRSARLNFKETISYETHKTRLADIALGLSPAKINPPNWGLADESLHKVEL